MKRMLPVVLDVIKKYGTNDPNEIAKAMNIAVKKVPLPDEIGGFFLKALTIKEIFINEKDAYNTQNVSLAHEIGHIVLHRAGDQLFTVHPLKKHTVRKQEYEANKFAFLLIAHTCLRNNIQMIDGIQGEKLLTFDGVLESLDIFKNYSCYQEVPK
jgi:Zn-dependent peptidase ImmA (M78 family)